MANYNDEVRFAKEFQTHIQQAEYNKAIRVAKKIIDYNKVKKFSTEREVTFSGMYLKIAEVYLHLHQQEKALFWLEKLAKVENKYIYPPHKQMLLQMFSALAQKMFSAQHYSKAALFQKKSFELSQELNGQNVDYTLSLGLFLGNIYHEMAEYRKAYILTKPLYTYVKNNKDINDIEVMKTAMNLGTYLMEMGKYAEAIQYQTDAIDKAQKIMHKNHDTLASMYNTIALSYIRMGDYVNAEEYLTHAMSIKKVTQNKDLSLVKIYNHRAFIFQELGNPKEALAYYQKSIQLLDLLNNKDKNIRMTLYANMAQNYMDLNDFNTSLAYYENVLKMQDEESLGKAYIYSGMGSVCMETGREDEALVYMKKSLALKKRYLGDKHLSLVYTYIDISNSLIAKHEYGNALFYDKKALSILQNNKHHYHLSHSVHLNMAYTYSMLGKVAQSYHYIDKAFSEFLKMKSHATVITSQNEKIYFKQAHRNFLHTYFSIAYAHVPTLTGKEKQKVLQRVLDNWIFIKRSVFEDSDNFRRFAAKSHDKKVKDEVAKLLNNQRILAQLYQSTRYDEKNKESSLGELQKKISRQEQHLSKMMREKHFIGEENQSIDTKNLSKKLNVNALYMDFVKTVNHYYLFTLDEKEHIAFYRFDKNATTLLTKSILKLQKEMNAISDKKTFADIEPVRQVYGKLYELVLKDVDISKYSSLVVSPDGVLNLLPFEALYDRKKEHYLLEQIKIQYVASAKDYFTDKPSGVTKEKITIFANPNFDANSTGKLDSSRGTVMEVLTPDFYKLPGTKKEAEDIYNIFPESILYVEENATEENLLHLKSPAILHIATHGFFLNPPSEYSPLLKNGIVLNGANHSLKIKSGEGIVTGLEISALPLDDTQLVVLSSCYSGLGDIEEGEGMMSLGDAFKKAGADNTLTSLWAVSDEMGARMMHLFYANLNKGDDYFSALKNAKLSLIKEGMVHPYYWANFVLYGEGLK